MMLLRVKLALATTIKENYGRYFANAINISKWRISYVAKTKVRLKSPKKVVIGVRRRNNVNNKSKE